MRARVRLLCSRQGEAGSSFAENYALNPKHKDGDATVLLQSEPRNSVNVATRREYRMTDESLMDDGSPPACLAALFWLVAAFRRRDGCPLKTRASVVPKIISKKIYMCSFDNPPQAKAVLMLRQKNK